MNPPISIRKGVAWTSLGTILTKALVLGNIFIILSQLSVYEYGLTELVFSVLSTVGIILLPGLIAIVTADISVEQGSKGRAREIFLQYAILMVILGTVAFLILFFGASVAAQLSGNPSIGNYLRIVSFSFLFMPLRTLSQVVATVEVRFKDLAIFSIIEEAVKFMALVIFFFVFHLGTSGLLYAYTIASAAGMIFFAPRTLSGYQKFTHTEARLNLRFWQLLGKHRKWGILATYTGTLTQNMRVWIIRALLGTEAVGLYAFASGILSNVSGLLPFTGVFTSLGPRYFRTPKAFLTLVRDSIKAQFVFSILLAVIAALTLPVLLIILPKYSSGAPLAYLLLVVLITSSTTAIFTPVFSILKTQISYLITMLIKLMLTVIILPLAIVSGGVLGIGIGMIIIDVLSGFERYRRLTKDLSGFSLTVRELVFLSDRERRLLSEIIRSVFKRRSLRTVIENAETIEGI